MDAPYNQIQKTFYEQKKIQDLQEIVSVIGTDWL